jgi:hypothetical protein
MRLQQKGKITAEVLTEFEKRLPSQMSVEDILDFIDQQPVVGSNKRWLIVAGSIAVAILVLGLGALIVGVILYPRITTPQTVQIMIKGRVVLDNGDSLLDSQVSLVLENSNQPAKTVILDAVGNYEITVQVPNDQLSRFQVCVSLPPNLGNRECKNQQINPIAEQSKTVNFMVRVPTPTPTRAPTFTPIPSPQPTGVPPTAPSTGTPVPKPGIPGTATPRRSSFIAQ